MFYMQYCSCDASGQCCSLCYCVRDVEVILSLNQRAGWPCATRLSHEDGLSISCALDHEGELRRGYVGRDNDTKPIKCDFLEAIDLV